jgi:hypothetical protein
MHGKTKKQKLKPGAENRIIAITCIVVEPNYKIYSQAAKFINMKKSQWSEE